MEILARAVGRRKEAVAQVQMVRGTGQFIINSKPAQEYLQNDSCTMLSVKAPFEVFQQVKQPSLELRSNNGVATMEVAETEQNNESNNGLLEGIDTIVKVKGGGLKGQSEAIRLGIARAICVLDTQSHNGANKALASNELATNSQTPTKSLATSLQDKTADLSIVSSETNTLKKQLRDKGYLTQDSRVKERRKYGLKKARKASQYHKR